MSDSENGNMTSEMQVPKPEQNFSGDYRDGYNAAVRFYEKHDAAREERMAAAEAEVERLKKEVFAANNAANHRTGVEDGWPDPDITRGA